MHVDNEISSKVIIIFQGYFQCFPLYYYSSHVDITFPWSIENISDIKVIKIISTFFFLV
jgi:hypothetical protein